MKIRVESHSALVRGSEAQIWQRGADENTNGLLRQYFPKGTDFKDVTEEDLAFAVKKLNHRLRK